MQDKLDFDGKKKKKGCALRVPHPPNFQQAERSRWRSIGDKTLLRWLRLSGVEGAGRKSELALLRPARAAAGGERASPELGEAQPPSDSSTTRGSRASTAGDAQRAPRHLPGPFSPRRPLASPRSPKGSRREGAWGQQLEGCSLSLPSHHGRCYSLPAHGLPGKHRAGLTWLLPAGTTDSFRDPRVLPVARFPAPAGPPVSASQGVADPHANSSPN